MVKTIYGVYRLSDFTEGRGPYFMDRIFEDEDEAWIYANSQLGIMGRPHPGLSWQEMKHGPDWKVIPHQLHLKRL